MADYLDQLGVAKVNEVACRPSSGLGATGRPPALRERCQRGNHVPECGDRLFGRVRPGRLVRSLGTHAGGRVNLAERPHPAILTAAS